MRKKNILIAGYGSIGRKHARNLIGMGLKPIVLTQYPDETRNISFINNIDQSQHVDFCIIATPTANHYKDLKNISTYTGCKNYLIEKPLESDLKRARLLHSFAISHALNVHVAYNMRFIKAFENVKRMIDQEIGRIRLVKITAGQYLPDWRSMDYRSSYSAKKRRGGGVHLDLSHEIDYMHWLFGTPRKVLVLIKKKISNLEITSIDYFKGLYEYPSFLVDVELDYFRRLERSIRFIGENQDLLFLDLVGSRFFVNNQEVKNKSLFKATSYIEELKEFLDIKPKKKLCSIDEGLKVMEAI